MFLSANEEDYLADYDFVVNYSIASVDKNKDQAWLLLAAQELPWWWPKYSVHCKKSRVDSTKIGLLQFHLSSIPWPCMICK